MTQGDPAGIGAELTVRAWHARVPLGLPPFTVLGDPALTGKPVRALCGKLWTPGRDPQKFPVCPTCKEVYESLK